MEQSDRNVEQCFATIVDILRPWSTSGVAMYIPMSSVIPLFKSAVLRNWRVSVLWNIRAWWPRVNDCDGKNAWTTIVGRRKKHSAKSFILRGNDEGPAWQLIWVASNRVSAHNYVTTLEYCTLHTLQFAPCCKLNATCSMQSFSFQDQSPMK